MEKGVPSCLHIFLVVLVPTRLTVDARIALHIVLRMVGVVSMAIPIDEYNLHLSTCTTLGIADLGFIASYWLGLKVSLEKILIFEDVNTVLEVPKEPARARTHWDHVLEEMVWLAKDFESERKWKLAQAKKVAIRVSKSGLDQASRGEKRLKEEEHRIRRLASNISKDVRKFWMKIEKLVLYKHQLELEERKKRALDKQLDFLLGQTERLKDHIATSTPVKMSGDSSSNDEDLFLVLARELNVQVCGGQRKF
eukprot:Gb_30813 [translate_table: standard]